MSPPTRGTTPRPPAVQRLLAAVDRQIMGFVQRRPSGRLVAGLLVAIALAAVWLVVLHTGGTRGPYLHAIYLPITFAAVAMGTGWGVAAAAAATLLLGPLMPLDVAAGTPQTTEAWLFRGAFFLGLAVLVGGLFGLLRDRLLRNRELHDELARVYSRNLQLFATLVAQRDEQTSGHCERVAHNAVAIGRRLGLTEEALGQLYWSGLLHDLGKIGVSEQILRKPGKLTDEEYAHMKRHCAIGRDILLKISEDFGSIADGVFSHHERWDGHGYPRCLGGKEIPLFGRILAVVDVYEAVTSYRPYRGPMSAEEALALIRDGRGTHFDPLVVDTFLAAMDGDEISHERVFSDADDAYVRAVSDAARGRQDAAKVT